MAKTRQMHNAAADMLDVRMRRVFGINVSTMRLDRGLTQMQLARLSGVSRPMISLIEVGTSNASLGTARRLAHALGTTLQELLTEK